ncbi:hypothetical protein MSAN_01490600 [Mycena sanguinolenta]|uniref:Uncharacterized protein n=1 Tax=Mycena sanguinolenta TaxID=230812 RepID=A0A8H6YAT7_9AGAR|nr:hypothetical protein MSAN_01490600 [Mycena sanguinolenta]
MAVPLASKTAVSPSIRRETLRLASNFSETRFLSCTHLNDHAGGASDCTAMPWASHTDMHIWSLRHTAAEPPRISVERATGSNSRIHLLLSRIRPPAPSAPSLRLKLQQRKCASTRKVCPHLPSTPSRHSTDMHPQLRISCFQSEAIVACDSLEGTTHESGGPQGTGRGIHGAAYELIPENRAWSTPIIFVRVRLVHLPSRLAIAHAHALCLVPGLLDFDRAGRIWKSFISIIFVY